MATNREILNSIRAVSSTEYQNRIPTATQDNLSKIATIIAEYPTLKNEFINVLTNQVVKSLFFQKVITNKLKMFKKGFMENGKTIESIFIDIVKSKSFDENFGNENSEVGSLLSRENVENVKIEYYSENFKNKYKMTISDERLKSAFRDSNGLSTLINQLLTSVLNSVEYDEYLMMKACIEQAKYKEIVSVKPVDNDSTKNFTKCLKTLIGKVQFPTRNYNNQNVLTYSKPSDLVILTTPEVQAELDIELLSSSFNMEKSEVESRIMLIDEFTDTQRIALIVDKEFLQFYETLNTSESFRNADGLYTNMFTHRWGLIAQCNFVTAIDIRTALSS